MTTENQELRRYLFNYYGGYLTSEEYNTWISIIEESKKTFFLKKPKRNELEINDFYNSTIERLLRDHKEDINLNICSVCNTLARTPKATICRNGHKKVNGVWVEIQLFEE
ncbi:hypothetical protein AB832_06215 [Flavobacteriaceae bacterium (ex Bugula neritina AB1)]|nr:hypothetical protein AB832_06215 [Flavobacteriaceae bacterium (ex Bugula neritina AB1)]